MKKLILKILIVALFLLAVPLSLLLVGFCTPAQYGETYYAELPAMYERLKRAEGKRIVVVGGSSVAFGLRGDLMEEAFEGYTVCPFGLYGSIGTKFMMDLAKDEIREGDIVLLLPEQGEQSLSLYFGAEHVLKAADGHFGLLSHVAYEDLGNLAGSFPAFVSQKYGYLLSGEPPVPTDVYARASFDENCMLVYDRPCNIMQGGVAPMEADFGTDVASAEFLGYVNEFARTLTRRGAQVLFGFAPLNVASLRAGTEESMIEAYRAHLAEQLCCEVMGTPLDYLFEREWFYDSNVHCNSAGAVVYTRRLVRDLKGCLGDDSPTEIELPEKPPLPAPEEEEGDDVHAGMFLYEADGDGLRIVGMTEEGKALVSVTVPVRAQGKRVTGFSAETFAGNSVVEEICLQSNIRSIEDGSFAGCSALKKLRMAPGQEPGRCNVFFALTEGAPYMKVYVERALLSAYANDYFWSRYADRLVGY